MSGHGIIKLRSGAVYEGAYEIAANGWVKFRGQLRTTTFTGTLYRAPKTHLWPRELVEWIRDGVAA